MPPSCDIPADWEHTCASRSSQTQNRKHFIERCRVTEVLWLAGLSCICLLGLLATVVRLPGVWLIFSASVAFSWYHDWSRPSWKVLVVLACLAVFGEVVELLAASITTRRAGATRKASWYALLGGFVGMIAFSIPLPIIGTVIGGLIGCFLGAAIAESTLRRDVAQGTRVGYFAAIGFVLGMVGKLMVAFVMVAAALISAWKT